MSDSGLEQTLSDSVVPGPVRSQEPDVRLAAHTERQVAYLEGVLKVPRRNPLHYILVALVLVGILLIGLKLQPVSTSTTPTCDRAPGAGVNWTNCRLSGLQAPDVVLVAASMGSGRFENADFSRANLKRIHASYAQFPNALLVKTNLYGAVLVGANFIQADLSGANLRGANLSYADLRGARLSEADLAGAILSNAIWIDGKVCSPVSMGACLVARE